MIDSHAHIISDFYEEIDEVIESAKENNVIKVLNCADSIKTSKEVLKLNEKFGDFLLVAVGIHPQNIDVFKPDEIEELIQNSNVKAVGEIGLDYNYCDENKEEQKKAFQLQLDYAQKYNLPVVIHIRDAMQDTYDILKERDLKGIIHCYSGSVEMARNFVKLGYLLGVGGVLTFKNSKLHEVIEQIDLKNIVLETDAPFLSPEPFRGKKNKPENIYLVAKKIASIKNIKIDEVITKTTSNFNELFNLK